MRVHTAASQTMGCLVGQFQTSLLRDHDFLFGEPITRETSASSFNSLSTGIEFVIMSCIIR